MPFVLTEQLVSFTEKTRMVICCLLQWNSGISCKHFSKNLEPKYRYKLMGLKIINGAFWDFLRPLGERSREDASFSPASSLPPPPPSRVLTFTKTNDRPRKLLYFNLQLDFHFENLLRRREITCNRMNVPWTFIYVNPALTNVRALLSASFCLKWCLFPGACFTVLWFPNTLQLPWSSLGRNYTP